MYEAFYGLDEKPFNGTPDPRFLILTPGHREALAHLIYGVQERKGFIVLSGEVGTGKTTLLNALRERLHPSTVVATLADPFLSFDDMLEGMLLEFGVPAQGSRLHRLTALKTYFGERCTAGLNNVLIIDEAQDLSGKLLEQIRLLSNFETPSAKSLQILLVGQPELAAKLDRPELRQLKQRIAVRYAIRPLSHEEAQAYIAARVRRAHARDNLFTDGAMALIAEYSGGIPRVINTLCDHCLVTGFGLDRHRVDTAIVKRAIDHIDQRAPDDPPRRTYGSIVWSFARQLWQS
jgi:general secretion pathway protein A